MLIVIGSSSITDGKHDEERPSLEADSAVRALEPIPSSDSDAKSLSQSECVAVECAGDEQEFAWGKRMPGILHRLVVIAKKPGGDLLSRNNGDLRISTVPRTQLSPNFWAQKIDKKFPNK